MAPKPLDEANNKLNNGLPKPDSVADPNGPPQLKVHNKIVQEVLNETKEGYIDILNPIPPIGLVFENVSIWA